LAGIGRKKDRLHSTRNKIGAAPYAKSRKCLRPYFRKKRVGYHFFCLGREDAYKEEDLRALSPFFKMSGGSDYLGPRPRTS